jgi:hypothetical protein
MRGGYSKNIFEEEKHVRIRIMSLSTVPVTISGRSPLLRLEYIAVFPTRFLCWSSNPVCYMFTKPSYITYADEEIFVSKPHITIEELLCRIQSI